MENSKYTAKEMREMAAAIINECEDEEAGLVYESPAKAGHIFYPDEAAAMLRQAAAMRERCEVLIHKLAEELKKSLHNCDVGTLEEQAERFREFCGNFQTDIRSMCHPRCPCIGCRNKCHCLTSWLQMPYKVEK